MGAVIFPIMLNKLFPVLGFAATIRAGKSRFPASSAKLAEEEFADISRPIVAYLMLGLLAISNIIMTPRQLPRRAHKPALPLLASFARERDAWLVCLGCFGCMIGAFIPLFYIVLYAKSHGVNGVLRDYSVRSNAESE